MVPAHQQHDEESDAALLEAGSQPSLQRRALPKVLIVSGLLAAVALMSFELHSHEAGQDEKVVEGSEETKMQMPTPSLCAYVVSAALSLAMIALTVVFSFQSMRTLRYLWGDAEVTYTITTSSAYEVYAAAVRSSLRVRILAEVVLTFVQPIIVLVFVLSYSRGGSHKLPLVPQVIMLLFVTLRLVIADLAFMWGWIREWIREGNDKWAKLPLLKVLIAFISSKADAADMITDATAVVSVLHL
eukprot:TRINITY_DN2956_c1_g1_i1.p1 TRINITY_DN2956_c1_g1~~TRINITY_DN2956_c1_g1_i1.p1  ORF type:complete len:259 (-),score=39.25 TRINITY_DN2956_c1_g1_i1:522-1250(-)